MYDNRQVTRVNHHFLITSCNGINIFGDSSTKDAPKTFLSSELFTVASVILVDFTDDFRFNEEMNYPSCAHKSRISMLQKVSWDLKLKTM